MTSTNSKEWIEEHIDSIDYQDLAPQIQQHVLQMLEQAIALSQSERREEKESIHDLRVVFKRLRSYWQLMRFMVSKPVFEAANQRIKLAAKLLGGQRDQQVLLDSLSIVSNQLKASEKDYAELQMSDWERNLSAMRKALSIQWPAVISSLQLEQDVWASLNCDAAKNPPLEKGVRKSLKRQFKLANQATLPDAGMEQRHRWRKWVKHVFYQLKLLKKLGLKGQKKTVNRFDELGELLGLEHDMEVLFEFLQAQEAQVEHVKNLKAIMKACRKQQAEFRKQADYIQKRIVKDV